MARLNTLMLMMVVSVALVLTGCGIKTRAYFDDRERVDIQPTGNAGYLMGTPPPEATQVSKKTRKVFIVEVTKDVPRDPEFERITQEIESMDISSSIQPQTNYKKTAPAKKMPESKVNPRDMQAPIITDDDFYIADVYQPVEEAAQVVDYVVEKDDTLQKISKKFYGSYSKWTKIYEANKEVIKNPNFLKPGTALKIYLGE